MAPTDTTAQTTISTELSSSPILYLGLSGETWDSLVVLSLIGAVIIAAAVAAATHGSSVVHKREAVAAERALTVFKLAVDGKVADATAAGIAAGKEAADAKGVAKTAQADIEKQKTLTAQAQLETERIKQTVAWRALSQTQFDTLERGLKAHPGQVNLRFTDGDPEALAFAVQFATALQRAGWQVAPGSTKFVNALVFGISIPNDPSPNLVNLRNAFSASGISFAAQPLPPTGAEFNVSTIKGAPFLMIGSRQPVTFP